MVEPQDQVVSLGVPPRYTEQTAAPALQATPAAWC